MLDGDPPNMVRYLFTDDRSRAAFPGWDRLADEQVAHLRNESSLHDPHVAVLADELTAAGEPFSDRLTFAGGSSALAPAAWPVPVRICAVSAIRVCRRGPDRRASNRRLFHSRQTTADYAYGRPDPSTALPAVGRPPTEADCSHP
ncbi:hypothetical protein [Streptomyces sp. RG80]|uniref:MmyB family transcriptional regulator n=1 Tax=Streptomyces sp. RG80 TaxID=3157340 RepID=UPI00338EF7A8